MTTELTDLPCACATARKVARVLTQLYDGKLRAAGIEAPQFSLMTALEKAGPSNQVDLGRRFALDKTTVSRNLKVLESNGWIQSSVGIDKRERLFTLTAAGRKKLDAAKPAWKKAQDQLRASMSTKQWDEMFRLFKTITRAAQSPKTDNGRPKTDNG